MWEYSDPMDPDRASPEELSRDEVWSYLDRVLQLGDVESLEGTPRPLRAMKLSNLVYSILMTFFFFLSTLGALATESNDLFYDYEDAFDLVLC